MQHLLNPPQSDEWIQLIGKYLINMGALETLTRVIIARLNRTDRVKIYSDDLSSRAKYLRSRYPNLDAIKHKKAMNIFNILEKHIGFRNIVAHSGILYGDEPGKDEKILVGLLNLKPRNINNIAEAITIEEMRERVNESAQLGKLLCDIQDDFVLNNKIRKKGRRAQ